MGTACALGWFLAACSVYEPGLIDGETALKPGGLGGASGKGGDVNVVAGTGMVSNGVSGDAGSGGSPPPAGGGDVMEKPAPETCGDGEVALSEKCDISIPAGMQGACPSACPELKTCEPRKLVGTGCDAECVQDELACTAGDGCCGPSCDHDSDSDCPANCGDGAVQADQGETCEPDSDTPCMTAEDCDDGDDCSKDVLEGSAENCNAKCSNTAITTAINGDGCCLDDSNHNVDSDCIIECGNGVREMGEECDGGESCDDECRLGSVLTADQNKCMQLIGQSANDCDKCSCLQCTKEQLMCRASGATATRDMQCTKVLDCSDDKNCVRDRCYCSEIDTLCINSIFDPGPCKTLIDDAVATEPPGSGDVIAQRDDSRTAIGRAVDTTDCNALNCADVCP
jgi:hypothetical protein